MEGIIGFALEFEQFTVCTHVYSSTVWFEDSVF